ncbi:MAG: hypothetical protein ACXVO9_09520, partial [Bacteroidia bacterium]
MIVDTHTHLYAEEFNADRAALIKKAISNGIKKFFLPNIDSTSIPLGEVVVIVFEIFFCLRGFLFLSNSSFSSSSSCPSASYSS